MEERVKVEKFVELLHKLGLITYNEGMTVYVQIPTLVLQYMRKSGAFRE